MPKKKKRAMHSVKPVFKIFCEGEKTEPLYINGYINHFHSEKRNIILVANTNKNTPVQLVDIAVEEKNNGNGRDIIWVVFDREAVSKYSHVLHAKARNKANDNGIQIAFSNVCFEYWLLLHFTCSTASYSSCADLLKNSSLKESLRKIGINNYEKNIPILFDKLKELIPDAIINATRINKAVKQTAESGRTAPSYLNPYVDVHQLFQDMKRFIDNKPSVRDK